MGKIRSLLFGKIRFKEDEKRFAPLGAMVRSPRHLLVEALTANTGRKGCGSGLPSYKRFAFVR